MHTHTARLHYTDALPIYRHIKDQLPSCLFESASAVDKSSRLSLIGLEPTLELVGKGDHLTIRLLHPRGRLFYAFILANYRAFVETERDDHLRLHI
ncbi:MAG: hypothetical protein ABIQ93_02835, partial [Saprospiraceae bacterium]